MFQESKMSKKRKNLNKRASKEQVLQIKKQIARKTKRVLFLLSIFLSAICLLLLFEIGEFVWPVWMLTHRIQIIGLLLFGISIMWLASPLIIEANSNSRPLSGSDDSPWVGPL